MESVECFFDFDGGFRFICVYIFINFFRQNILYIYSIFYVNYILV